MTIARKNLINPSQLEHHHLISRCVRRSFLLGDDGYCGINFDHRKDWIQDRLKLLVKNFTIEVGGYAIMDNHLHLEVRNRSDLNLELSDREVIDRWINIYTPRMRFSKKLSAEALLENHKLKVLKNSNRMAELRKRLSDISWLMKALKEFIARKANKEDSCTGPFWEPRFKSQLLATQEAVILCQAYIDLNPIRASIAETPESSDNTSVFDRIESSQSRQNVRSAIKLKESQGELTEDQKKVTEQTFLKRNNDKWLAPFYKGDGHVKCFYMNDTQNEYLELLDWSGREIKKNKSGAIPSHLAPIFNRLKLDRELWIEALKNYRSWFGFFVGKFEKAYDKLTDVTQHFFRNGKANRKMFG